MKHIYRFTTTVVAFLFIASMSCAAQDGQNIDRHRAMDAIFKKWDNNGSPGCAAGVILNNKLEYANGYGMANLEHNVPITPDTVFYIASTSKHFAAMATLLAARQGYFSLDDDIRKFFPEIPDYGKTITIKNLIQHTSGLRDYFAIWSMSGRSMSNYFPPDQILDLIARQKSLMFEPGTEWSYSNSGYILMSFLIERTTGKTMREFAQKFIFTPLDMNNSHFHDDHKMIVKNRAIGHQKKPDESWEMAWSSFDLVGSGGLHTTVKDMVKWNANFENNKLEDGSNDLIPQFLEPGFDIGKEGQYGFGLMHNSYRGLKVVSHSGGSFGYRAHYMRIPEKNYAAVALCNSSSINPRELLKKVTDIYLFDGNSESKNVTPDEPAKQPEKIAQYQPTNSESQRLVGDYYSSELDSIFRVRIKNGTLQLRRGYADWDTLNATGKNTFYISRNNGASKIPVDFQPAANGSKDTLVITADRMGTIKVERVK